MFNSIRIIIFLLLVCSALSCSTTNTSDEKENKKIATAKINASLGLAYLEQRNVARAKQKLLLALDEAPNIPETWYSMAYFLEATGNPAKAKKYYLKAVELSPNRGDSQNNYGTYLCRTGHYRDAIEHFLTAADDPTYLNMGAAYENAGLCALKIPNKQLAYKYFEMALMQDPNRQISANELRKLEKKG